MMIDFNPSARVNSCKRIEKKLHAAQFMQGPDICRAAVFANCDVCLATFDATVDRIVQLGLRASFFKGSASRRRRNRDIDRVASDCASSMQ